MTELPELVGTSVAIENLRADITEVAASTLPVVIEGETGVGKELVAQAIHAQSSRSGAFVPVNVCAIPEAMFESAMFGHVRGAFTGAIARSDGFLVEANRGTVFLDEIGTLGMGEQAKLLRAIETGIFRPVGAERDARSNFRVVVATNIPLRAGVRTGAFRADLAYRLMGCVISVPPLRERRSDIPRLIAHFMTTSPGGEFAVSDAVMNRLCLYDWPGNVRQLRHLIASLSLRATRGRVTLESLTRFGIDDSVPTVLMPQPEGLLDAERRGTIIDALRESNSDTAAAAKLLGVHRATLYRWIASMGIPHVAPRGARRALELSLPRDQPLATTPPPLSAGENSNAARLS